MLGCWFRPKMTPLPLPLSLAPSFRSQREHVRLGQSPTLPEHRDCKRRGWEENTPAKLLQGKAKHPKKAVWRQTSSILSVCYLQLSLQQGYWGKSPGKEKIQLSGQNWSPSPQIDHGRWELKDAKPYWGCSMVPSFASDACAESQHMAQHQCSSVPVAMLCLLSQPVSIG